MVYWYKSTGFLAFVSRLVSLKKREKIFFSGIGSVPVLRWKDLLFQVYMNISTILYCTFSFSSSYLLQTRHGFSGLYRFIIFWGGCPTTNKTATLLSTVKICLRVPAGLNVKIDWLTDWLTDWPTDRQLHSNSDSVCVRGLRNSNGRDNSEDPGVDRKIILKWLLVK